MHLTVDIFYDAWQEGAHPRGQPKNKGEFAKKGSGIKSDRSKLRQGAKEFASTASPGAADVVPTLAPEFWKTVDPVAISAIQEYTGGAGDYYKQVNGALRNQENGVPIPPAIAKEVAAIDKVFAEPRAKCTADVVLRRVANVPRETVSKWADALAKGAPARFTPAGFVSTTLADKVLISWSDTQLEIVARKGTPVLGVDTISHNRGENEVLLPHGQTFEVLGIEEHRGKQRIIRCATVV